MYTPPLKEGRDGDLSLEMLALLIMINNTRPRELHEHLPSKLPAVSYACDWSPWLVHILRQNVYPHWKRAETKYTQRTRRTSLKRGAAVSPPLGGIQLNNYNLSCLPRLIWLGLVDSQKPESKDQKPTTSLRTGDAAGPEAPGLAALSRISSRQRSYRTWLGIFGLL